MTNQRLCQLKDLVARICDIPDLSDIDDDTILMPQSGTDMGYVKSETMKSENVRFSDQYNGPTTTIEGRDDKTRSVTDTTDTELANFFARPIKIEEFPWSVGGSLNATFNPWTLYFSNKRVENRITTYNLIRAKLHMKIVVNGNGFYYGRAIAAYGAFDAKDDFSDTSSLAALTTWSQRPKIFIDPTKSMGGEIVIPWHYYKNNGWIRDQDWSAEMCNVFLRSLNPLLHSNGGTDPVTVSIFAWAEDVSLSVLTSYDISALTPQSGDEVDEANAKGVVSGPASAIAKWSGMLSDVPIIGPYATATSRAAGFTADVASALGYCKPAVTKAPEPYRPSCVSSLANVNVPDTINKLTVDHKQELTIDPAVAGIGSHDPLSIVSIASRESYIAQFAWPKATSAEALLWNMRVDPVLWNSTGSDFIFPACAAAALPFKYWTGTMKIRFQIVASSFHKGRLKIVYDPNEIDSNEYNTNYLKIVDIAEEQDFTIEVGIGQARTLIGHSEPGIDLLTSQINTTKLNASSTHGNGIVGVYVVNTLSTPGTGATNDIAINVYVSMGDDFEVFVPDSYFQNFVLQPQSGDLIPESENTEEPNAPMHMKSESIAVQSWTMPETNLVYTGESISSFRSMLKRYNRWMCIGVPDNGASWISFNSPLFPALRGSVSGAIHTTSGAQPYNYMNTVMVHWVTYMFSGWRGSMRYKVIPKRGGTYCDITASRLTNNGGALGYSFGSYAAASLSSASEIASSIVLDGSTKDKENTGAEGLCYTNSHVNPVLEFEVPFYSPDRFYPGKRENWGTGLTDIEYFNVYINQISDYGDFVAPVACYDLFVAAGEDFQTYFFTGLPPLYYEASPPAPAL
jgi:hypothetical protein